VRLRNRARVSDIRADKNAGEYRSAPALSAHAPRWSGPPMLRQMRRVARGSRVATTMGHNSYSRSHPLAISNPSCSPCAPPVRFERTKGCRTRVVNTSLAHSSCKIRPSGWPLLRGQVRWCRQQPSGLFTPSVQESAVQESAVQESAVQESESQTLMHQLLWLMIPSLTASFPVRPAPTHHLKSS
jgi:hypothetical protein